MQPGYSITGMSARKKLPSWLQRCHGDQTHPTTYREACGPVALEMAMIQTFIMPWCIVSYAWWFGVDGGGGTVIVGMVLLVGGAVGVVCSDSGGSVELAGVV